MMSRSRKRILSMVLVVIMLMSLLPTAFAAPAVENSPYSSMASIGDSISAGYGPLMNNNDWPNYYYKNPTAGSYPYLLSKDLGIDLSTSFNSMLCVDQRLVDAYYAMGKDPADLVDPSNPTSLTAKVDYLSDAREYHSEAYMEVLENLHNSGEGAERIKNSELITVMIGMADLSVYPVKRTRQINGSYDTDSIAALMTAGATSYPTNYTKLISAIRELNPNAKILILGLYDPYVKFTATGTQDQAILALERSSITTGNSFLKTLAATTKNCTYVDITGLGDYIDTKATTPDEGKLVSSMISHENHPGAAGHQYVENQILSALGLNRASLTPSVDANTSYLAFSSDVHTKDGAESLTRLDSWIDNVSDKLGDVTFEYMGFCGDLASASISERPYANKVQMLMNTVENNTNVVRGIYTTGNHEYSPGGYASRSNEEPYASLTRIGGAANTDKYQIFCFGAAQYNQQFNDDDIAVLKDYLATADKDEPIFVLSHFPLHKYNSRTSTNASKVISVLNNYPNVIFLWGHNHTESDTHYGKVYSGDLDGTRINFTYCAAGCMSDSEYSSGSKNTTGKGLVAAIDGDSDLTLTYYDKNYNVTTSYLVNIADGTSEQIYSGDSKLDPNFNDLTYASVSSVSAGDYVIAVDNIAMNTTAHDGYQTLSNNINYAYSGLAGNNVKLSSEKITAGVTVDNIWTLTSVSGGYTIQNAEGLYLTGKYTSEVGGSIQLEETSKNGVWTYSDGALKNVATGKMLNFEVESDIDGTQQGGEANLFTLRSKANDTVKFYKAVTGNEKIKTSNYAKTNTFVDGSWYIITAENQALIGSANTGYVTKNNGNTYQYIGLDGKAIVAANGYLTSDVSKDMLWQAVAMDNGFALRNKDGKYLKSSYTTDTNGYTGIGKLYLSSNQQAWILDGTSLKNADNSKYFEYQSGSDIDGTKQSGNAQFFTIRSSSKDTIAVYRALSGDGEMANKNEVIDSSFIKVQPIYSEFNLSKSGIVAGDRIVLAKNGMYLSSKSNTGYIVRNSKYYKYTGLSAGELGMIAGESLTSISRDSITSDMVWTVAQAKDGVYLINNDGKYLSATYNSSTTIDIAGNSYDATIGDLCLRSTPNSSSIWTFYDDQTNEMVLKNKGCGKYIKYNNGASISSSDTLVAPIDKNSISLFTIRSSAAKDIYAYAQTMIDSCINSGKQYVIVSPDGYAMSSNTGTGYNDKSSNYRYEGLTPVKVTVDGSSITSTVTSDMVWTIKESGKGYTIQNSDGKYLNCSYDSNTVIHTYLSDTPKVWTLNNDLTLQGADKGSQLSYETNGGTASVFTLRSIGQSMSFYEVSAKDTKTALYVANAGGTVSASREVVGAEGTFVGSEATALDNYTFAGWYQGEELVSKDAKIIPTEAGVYEARFIENTVTINYQVKLSGEYGNVEDLKLTKDAETVGVATGIIAGSTAKAIDGYTFLYWTSDAEGKTVVSKNAAFTPKTKSDSTYYAWYEKELVCYADELVTMNEVAAGTYNLVINGTDCGKFVFTKNGNAWTIYSVAQKKFVSLDSSNKLTYSTTAKDWTYTSKGFYTAGARVLLLSSNYYLTVSNGSLAVSRTAPSKTTFAETKQVGHLEHDGYVLTENGAVCTRCGKVVEGVEIEAGKVTAVNVAVTKATTAGKIVMNGWRPTYVQGTTTYTAKISATAENTTVKTIEYSTDGGNTYTVGDTFTSSSNITSCVVRVTDGVGVQTIWNYSNGSTTQAK